MGVVKSEAKNLDRSNSKDDILVIHSYHPELSTTEEIKEGINEGFKENHREVNIYHEYLDSNRHPRLEHGREFLDYIQKKYRSTDLDLLMVADDPGLELIINQRDRYFSRVPVVFLGINQIRQELLEIPWLTGVFENYSMVATAIEATKQMNTNTLIIINDSTATGKANLNRIRELKKLPQAPKNIEIINDLSIDQIKHSLGAYPPHVPILLLGQLRENDANYSLVDPEQDVEILQEKIPNPIYTENWVHLGKGVVGGRIFDNAYHARQAVELAIEILDGANPDQIGPTITAKNRWVFDYRRLKQYHIAINRLPKDSELIYIDPSFYEKHQQLVWVFGVSFFVTLLVVALLIEILRRRSVTEKILRENEQRYKDLAKAGANVFWELDEKLKYSYVSGDTKCINGVEPHEMLGRYPEEIYRDNPKFDFDWQNFQQTIQNRRPLTNFTFSFKEDNKSIRIFKLNATPLFDRDRKFLGYRGIKQEITAEHNLSKKIAYQATYDALTGLLNRTEFDRRLKKIVQQIVTSGQEAVFCYLDLDRFKIVNDTAGHLVGDRLLTELANIFRQMIRKGDTLGRLGGDEFGLILEDCSIPQAQKICEELIDAIHNYRFKWETLEFDVGVSIGIVPILPTSVNAAELLSRADLACYQAKDLGRGRVYIAESQDKELDLQQTQMSHIANVSQAIAENRFYLVKQLIKPVVEVNRQYWHYEILLRLKDRYGKAIAPNLFIPIAERYGVITIVDRWVLETTIKSYSECFSSQQALVSINLSGASINDDRFTDFAISLIKNAAIPGDRLCFEITETAAISQIDRAQKFIVAMKELGVKFALDDFGSGVSSFAYLKNLPVDYLKIDGSLIENITHEKYDLAIVNSINQVAHFMGMETIAEFVENDKILKRLDRINVDYAQGYHTGKPIAIADNPLSLMN
ncbi:MAG: hypothetical protein Tsb0014_24190 [Pleurocapsa sp.]